MFGNQEDFFYPDTIVINGTEYKGQRSQKGNSILIPYLEEPDIGIGDLITQKAGKRIIEFKVTDVSFEENGSMNSASGKPHMLTLEVENMTALAHKPERQNPTLYHIGSISGTQVQVGNQNTQTLHMNIEELAEKIASNPDPEAKNIFIKLLQNTTVVSILGKGASTLIDILKHSHT